MLTYDRTAAWQQGYEDATNGFPRQHGHGNAYRQGYDRGLTHITDMIKRNNQTSKDKDASPYFH